MVDYDFDIALLSTKEVTHVFVMADEGCGICEWISRKALLKTEDGNWWVVMENLEDSDAKHLEKLIKRKLGDDVIDMVIVAGRYTSNQF